MNNREYEVIKRYYLAIAPHSKWVRVLSEEEEVISKYGSRGFMERRRGYTEMPDGDLSETASLTEKGIRAFRAERRSRICQSVISFFKDLVSCTEE